MARAEPPTSPPGAFSHRITVVADDIDALGHAGNVRWVDWVQDVAEAHSAGVGLGPERYEQRGLIWVVRRHEIDYLGEALEGQTLEVATWIESSRGATCLRRTQFHRADTDIVLARAATTWALLSSASGRPTRIPKDIMETYGASTQT